MVIFKDLNEEEKKEQAAYLFQKLESASELKDWVYHFFGLDMPIGNIDPDSTSAPVDAMWEIYNTIKMNTGDKNPGYIMLSAREGFKTLSASILEALIMVHFELTIAHMAAIQSQSAKSIQYINYFFNKIEPILHYSGWVNRSQNKGKVEYRTPEGEDVYIKVIIASLSGANSEHTSLLFVDEIDVVKDPMAYDEAKLIPGYVKGIYPLTVKLSTRKFAFGLMQRELDLAPTSGDKILRWNILDVTEACPPERHQPTGPKKDVYVHKALPLTQISAEEFQQLPEAEQLKFEVIKQAHFGCQGCALLPVCKMRLSQRPATDRGGLYKPISVVINNFRKTPPDMAEAQLMCWKPSSKGLVYPRFDSIPDKGNVITVKKAWETVIGPIPNEKVKNVEAINLIQAMKNVGIRFLAGVDWGYTHDFVIVIFAMIPNGEVWVIDCYSAPGLEFSDQLEIAKSYRDKYYPDKWWCDTAMPANMKSFNRNHMKSPKFTKDVMGGIEALRFKILDSYGRRMLKVLDVPANKKVINAFLKHHFQLGPDGEPTLQPDDTPGTSDQADALRYVAQNAFPVKGPQKPEMVTSERDKPTQASMIAEDQMKQEIAKRIEQGQTTGGTGKKGGFHFSF